MSTARGPGAAPLASRPAPRLDRGDLRAFAWFMLCALVLLAAGIGLRDPWPSDEPRFALVAQQMVASGDWLFPHRGSELYADKPPLFFWLQAASHALTGNWRVAFLLPSLLAGLLTLGLVWDLGRRLWSPRVGLVAATALLFSFQFTWQFKRAQIDPVLVAWVTLANWGLLRHLLRGPDWRGWWLGCAAAGVGVITKGVGIIALLLCIPFLVLRRRGWPELQAARGPAWRWALGGAFLLLPILAWLAPMLASALASGDPEHAAYVRELLFHQTATRYAASWHHVQPAWYFLPIVLFAWLPLSLALPGLLPRWREAWRAQDARIALLLGWIALVLLFFSIPRGKRDVYILPALPMFALAAAPWLEELIRRAWLRRAAFALALGGGVVLAVLGFLGLAQPQALPAGLVKAWPDAQGAVWAAVAAMGFAFLGGAAWGRLRRGAEGLLAGFAGFWLVWSLAAAPLLDADRSARRVMEEAGRIMGPAAELALVAWKEQNLLMADRPARDFGFKVPWPEQFVGAVAWLEAAPERRWVFALREAMGDCVDLERAVFVGRSNRRDWWLFQLPAVVPGCRPGEATDKEAGD